MEDLEVIPSSAKHDLAQSPGVCGWVSDYVKFKSPEVLFRVRGEGSQ